MEWAFLAVGAALGATLAWFFAQRARGPLAVALAGAEERARGEAERRGELERRLDDVARARSELERRAATADEQVRQARALLEEQRAFVGTAQERMEQAFKAAAADAIQGNTDHFLALAKQRLDATRGEATAELEAKKVAIDALLAPLRETLGRLESHTGAIERARTEAYARIETHVTSLATLAAGIQRETVVLSTALKGTQVRGRWGEVALRNVVELAGMTQHVDFAEQETLRDGKRPDLVVRLPGARRIAVDAKATTEFYLEAVRAGSDAERDAALTRHAAAVRARVRDLASKDYAAHLDGSVDLVVLFLPGDPFLGAACARDPDLHVDALKQRVLIATPTTLVGLLRTVGLYHQQEAVARDAEQIARAAKTLYERGAKFAEHLAKVGRRLSDALGAYNDAVGSFEGRFLPAGAELERLQASRNATQRLEAPKRVEGSPRLVVDAAPEPLRSPARAAISDEPPF